MLHDADSVLRVVKSRVQIVHGAVFGSGRRLEFRCANWLCLKGGIWDGFRCPCDLRNWRGQFCGGRRVLTAG